MEGQSPSKKARTHPQTFSAPQINTHLGTLPFCNMLHYRRTADAVPFFSFQIFRKENFHYFTVTAPTPQMTAQETAEGLPSAVFKLYYFFFFLPSTTATTATASAPRHTLHTYPHHRHTAPSPRANIMQTASHSSRSLVHTFSRLIPLTA